MCLEKIILHQYKAISNKDLSIVLIELFKKCEEQKHEVIDFYKIRYDKFLISNNRILIKFKPFRIGSVQAYGTALLTFNKIPDGTSINAIILSPYKYGFLIIIFLFLFIYSLMAWFIVSTDAIKIVTMMIMLSAPLILFSIIIYLNMKFNVWQIKSYLEGILHDLDIHVGLSNLNSK